MGMELHGINPKSHSGKIYRGSIWIWHPMWNYLEINYQDIIKNINGHSNDGDIVNADISEQLGSIILEDLKNNKIQEYLDSYNNFIDNLPKTICEYCLGFGFERKNVLIKLDEVCFRCHGAGKSKMFITNYRAYIHDFYMFASFLNNSGGFKIL